MERKENLMSDEDVELRFTLQQEAVKKGNQRAKNTETDLSEKFECRIEGKVHRFSNRADEHAHRLRHSIKEDMW